MKIKSMLASAAACAVAVSAMVLCVGAEKINDKISLNSKDEDAKIWQYDLSKLTGGTTIKNVAFDVTCPFAATGWAGGGGAFGMNFGEEWYQADFAAAEDSADTFHVSLDIPASYKDVAQDLSDGLLQIGWWWGAGDTAEITNLEITFEAAEEQPAETTSAQEKPADEKPAASTPASNTGDAGVGIAVAGLVAAGAVAVIAARKKD